jgi:hypothetical protein
VDARADVYALGAMLASMLTAAESAPPGSQLEPALRRHHVPARLRAICLKATASSPDDRYADAAALADDIARYRAGLRVSAHRETALERLARFVSTYRVPILLVLAYLVMRVLVAIYAALNPLVR